MTEKKKEFEEYGGKPYGEIKCPFFTKSGEIPDELNKETVCTKCWAKYDYNCYYPKFFDCDQYDEMLKTINPEYLKSVVDALRIGSDIEICYAEPNRCKCECTCEEPKVIGTLSIGDVTINVLTYDKKKEVAFSIDGDCEFDVGITIMDEDDS